MISDLRLYSDKGEIIVHSLCIIGLLSLISLLFESNLPNTDNQ